MRFRSFRRGAVPLAALTMLLFGRNVQGASDQPSPVVWLKADAITGLKDGDAVASWPDSSGAGNKAVQASDLQQPTYVANAVNGKPAVHFDDTMGTFLALKLPASGDFTIFCVFRSTAGIGSDVGWWFGAGLVTCDQQDVYHEYGLALNADGQVLAGAGDPDKHLVSGTGYNEGQAHIATFARLRRTGEMALFVDGALAAHQATSTTEAFTAPTHLLIGASRDNGKCLTGDIAEVAVFAVALTPAQRQTAERNLEVKYGITPAGPLEGALTIPAAAREQPVILPPDPKPAIHGPRVVGASPGRPFLFRIPATGQEPLTFAAADLPAGLTIDPQTGIITGAVTTPGNYDTEVTASNTQGKATRTLTLVCGDHVLARTPLMGWNSWNIDANAVTDTDVRAAAEWLVKMGLAAHGYQYVAIDDSWEGGRDLQGNILPNHRFPDMKALAADLHGQGLKLGIYSAATEHTPSGFAGSLGHEAQDAATYAQWGVDAVKYDWNPEDPVHDTTSPIEVQAAFQKMREALDKTGRDMVFTITTHGKYNIGDWAAATGANVWDASPTLLDTWWSLTGRRNQGWDPKPPFGPFGDLWPVGQTGPGHWSDPGFLMVGRIGYGQVHVTHLTPAEQMTQVSLWSLLAAPLTLSCDLTALDPNALHPSTTALLTNDEVLDVDQGPKGQAAVRVEKTLRRQIWARPLADGTTAVGLFNLTDRPVNLRVPWSALKLTGPQPVRDLWLHRDLGTFTACFSTEVPPHGVALLKVGRPQ